MKSHSIASVLQRADARLTQYSETHTLDASTLLMHLLHRSRAWLYAHPETVLSPEQVDQLEQYLIRLENGEPLPYVIGHWEFYGLDIIVTPAVLIPRPETEILIDYAKHWLITHPQNRLAADIGCGSGCIGITLAHHFPNLRVVMTDIIPSALDLALKNVQNHHLEQQIICEMADLWPAGDRLFDLVCANLPYIPTKTLRSLKVSQWEPLTALDGGSDGLAIIHRLLAQAPHRLTHGGLLLLEIEARQSHAAFLLAQEAFPSASIDILKDLAGLDRVVAIQTG